MLVFSAAEGSVAADHHHAVDLVFPAGFHRLLHPRFGAELRAAGGVEHGSAPVDDIRHAAQIHGDQITVDQAVVSAIDAEAFHTLAQRRADHGADPRVHARRVAAAG